MDTPGQMSLSRKMISGLTEANIVVLLLDVRDVDMRGYEFYFTLLNLLKTQYVILAVNKMDLVAFDQKKYQAFLNKIKQHCALDKNLHVLPIAALTGENIFHKSRKMPWHNGKSLYGILKEAVAAQIKIQQDNFLMPVQSSVLSEDRNASLGRIEGGSLRKGEEVEIFAGGKFLPKQKCSAILIGQKKVTKALEGDNVAVFLEKNSKIARGSVMLKDKKHIRATNKIRVWLFVAQNFSLDSKNLSLRWLTATEKITNLRIIKTTSLKHGQDELKSDMQKKKINQNEFIEAELELDKNIVNIKMKIAIVDKRGDILAVGGII